ncbi:MAG: NAD(+) kinase, partial [Propionibacteriales bacterium]|nr:NAD(+) kinase [Propionibacteriales bacterium]
MSATTDPARRSVLLIAHTGRAQAVEVARAVAGRLMAGSVTVRVLVEEAADLGIDGAEVV